MDNRESETPPPKRESKPLQLLDNPPSTPDEPRAADHWWVASWVLTLTALGVVSQFCWHVAASQFAPAVLYPAGVVPLLLYFVLGRYRKPVAIAAYLFAVHCLWVMGSLPGWVETKVLADIAFLPPLALMFLYSPSFLNAVLMTVYQAIMLHFCYDVFTSPAAFTDSSYSPAALHFAASMWATLRMSEIAVVWLTAIAISLEEFELFPAHQLRDLLPAARRS
jgi:hypothetical protein